MADTYEKDLAQKSSLTTSDFIRVVGSDNVSYKQGMSTVASVINSVQPIETHSGSIKQWALQRNGQAIICTSPTRTTDLPDIPNKYGIAWAKSYVADTNKWVNLYWSPTNVSDIYICSNMSNVDSWTAWQKIPTRAEVNALTNAFSGVSFTRTSTTANTPKSITLPNNYRGIIAFVDTAQGRDGLYFLTANSSGAVNYAPIYATSDLTLDKSVANTLAVTSTATTMIAILNISGEATA